MLDLADIQTAWLDPTRSLASDQFKPQKRWVNAPDPIDWDTATTRGACYALVPDRTKAIPAIAGKGAVEAAHWRDEAQARPHAVLLGAGGVAPAGSDLAKNRR
jgi:hypothetical protein